MRLDIPLTVPRTWPQADSSASQRRLEKYVVALREEVRGWLSRLDAEILRALLAYQSAAGLTGAVAEIGVHHGRSFLALALGRQPGERGYCIDVFEDQHLNADGSGRGDRVAFEENLRRFGVEDVVIRQASSMDVKANEILSAVGPVRLFSVDGGHWLDIVRNDLALAAESLADHGVIALDDFHRAEWPEVSGGFFAWREHEGQAYAPFAIGANKLYLCRRSYAAAYRQVIFQDAFLSALIVKSVGFLGESVPVFAEALDPEFSARRRVLANLRVYGPALYRRYETFRQRYDRLKHAARGMLRREPQRV
jgi:hypothetical protein